MKSLKIGDIKLKNPLFLAPMVDVTNLPYRLISRKCGAAIAYTEMLHIEQILHENTKTLKSLKTTKEDKPLGLQITGRTLKDFKKIIPFLKKHEEKYNLIDLNCGCPSMRLIRSGAGSYLLKEPEKISKAIKLLKNEGFTITAKIRLGIHKNNSLKIAKAVELGGADLITVHARLATQSSSKPAKWNEIKKIKDKLGIPVVGNGDIFNGKNAKEMLEICDGAMIARAAIGNPLIFKQILHYLKTGKELRVLPKKNIKLFLEYLKLSKKHKVFDINKARYVGTNFVKGYSGASKYREKLSRIKTFDKMRTFINNEVLEAL